MSAPREIVVERHYIDDRDAQVSALKVLLNHATKEKTAGANGGSHAEERSKNARRNSILPNTS